MLEIPPTQKPARVRVYRMAFSKMVFAVTE